MSKRDQIVEQMKAQLDQINGQIDTFEAKASEVSSEAKRQYEERVKELRAMARPVEELLARIKTQGAEHRERLEAEADKTYKALVHSYNYFKSQMK